MQTLGGEAIACPMVTWSFGAAKFLAQSQEAPKEAGVTRMDSENATIRKALADNPFSSVREL
jgi:hypothetical protein